MWLLILLKVESYFTQKLLHLSVLWSPYFNSNSFLSACWALQYRCRILLEWCGTWQKLMGIWGIWLGFDNICSFLYHFCHACRQNIFLFLFVLLLELVIYQQSWIFLAFLMLWIWLYKNNFTKITHIYLHLFLWHLWRCLFFFQA